MKRQRKGFRFLRGWGLIGVPFLFLILYIPFSSSAATICTCNNATFEVISNTGGQSDCGQSSMCVSLVEYILFRPCPPCEVTHGEVLSGYGCEMKVNCPGAPSGTVKPGNTSPEGYSPKNTSTTNDPISGGGGEFREYWTPLSLGGPLPLGFSFVYAPDLEGKTPSSDGRTQFAPWDSIKAFTSNTMIRIVEFEDRSATPSQIYLNVLFYDDLIVFRDDGTGTFQPVGPEKYQVKKSGDYYYIMNPLSGLVYIFQSRAFGQDVGNHRMRRVGEVVYVLDRNGNRLSYTYNGDRLPTRVEDNLGRRLDLAYVSSTSQNARHLQSVTDGYGRTVGFTYQNLTCGGSSSSTLTRFTDPMGQATNFEYDITTNSCYRIQKINRPLGNSHIDQRWTKNPQNVDGVNSQKDAYGNEATLSWAQDAQGNLITTVNQPDGTKRIFHHEVERYPLDVTDETNKKYTMSYNADRQPTSLDDRLGDSTDFTYHPQSGKPTSITNAKGNTITYAYAVQDQIFTNPANSEQVTFTFYNLTQITYPNPTTEQFTYDAKGNMVTRIDRAGKTWTYTYNSKGQVLTITNPSGGVTTYTYNNDGTLASSRDSDTGTTTYAYDTYKRLNQITRPDGETILIAHNLNDQITSITDENNHIFTYQYDANGNLTKVTDPAGKQTQYAYDLMDRVNQVTDRLNKVSTYAYNNMERLSSTTDPNNIATGYGYDTRGWLNSVTLGGQTWTTGYDDEGIVTSRKTPLNNTTTYQSDKLGFTTGITNPLNQTTTLTRDALSRITGITDPLSRTTTYGYDSRGLLSGVTMPVIGTATYQRSDLGLLSQITDLNSQNWTFGYTNMGRPNSNTDPLGNTWNQTYDTRGRPSQTTYPDGSTLTTTYDDAGNLTRMLYSGAPDLQYTYNELNMLTGTNGITFTRDNENRITATDNPGTVFGATYDDGGRLKTTTYPSTSSGQALITVTYTYDATTGLLSGVTDNLTNTQIGFNYDNDRKMTGITRSNGVNTAFTWDNASRPIRFQDGPSTGSGFIDLQYTLNAAGQITRANMTVPLDPANLLQSGTESFAYDSASRVSTAGYSHDQRGRMTGARNYTFTWDGASRLTGINPSTGSGQTTLAYNGLGDLITRTESGNTIHYYYNYAIGLNPIVAEKNDSTGQFLRYYIWTPGGRLLYMIDAANSNKVYFYHFDLNGSTLALTDSTGAVTDKYAYDPYGELLGHQGSNQQPFTFVGQWGVRHEGSTTGSAFGTLYHMRAQYYDAVTQRFLNREPIWPFLTDPKSVNPYQYVGQNPLSFIDPSGLRSFEGWVDRYMQPVPMNVPVSEGTIQGLVTTNGSIIWAVFRNGSFDWIGEQKILEEMGSWYMSDDELGKLTLWLYDQLRGNENRKQFEKRMAEELAFWINFAQIKPKPAPPQDLVGQRQSANKGSAAALSGAGEGGREKDPFPFLKPEDMFTEREKQEGWENRKRIFLEDIRDAAEIQRKAAEAGDVRETEVWRGIYIRRAEGYLHHLTTRP